MRRWSWLLTVFAAVLAAPAWSATALHYGGPVGQVAEYRLRATLTGTQVSLGERRPIRAEMEWELRQEVVSVEPGGAFTVEESGRLLGLNDTTGAFGARPTKLPLVRLHFLPTGEISGPAVSAGPTGLQGQALVSLLAQPLPVVLPCTEAEVGVPWQWAKDGARQTNTLVQVASGLARITSQGSAPITLEEHSEALGLTTRVTGTETETATLDLQLDPGVVVSHTGHATVTVRSDVELVLPQGPRSFPMQLEAQVEFDLRLTKLNGRPVFHAARGRWPVSGLSSS